MRTEVGREAGEWRGRGVLVLLGGGQLLLLLMLLLRHAGPQLHAISMRVQQSVSDPHLNRIRTNSRVKHFHGKRIRVHKRVERRGLSWPAKRCEADAVDIVVVECRVDVLL